MRGDRDAGALTQLRAYLAGIDEPPGARLAPERELCGLLGVSRGALRKALAVLEAEGRIWRHVGRGTFLGSRPLDGAPDIAAVAGLTSPGEVMEARLLVEPELARLAALNATAADLRELGRCARRSRAARDWRGYESWDNRLHRAVAEATRNALLLALFDSLNAIRRTVVWNRRRNASEPPRDHHSFAEHEVLIAALAERDPQRAAAAMRTHLESVRRRLLDPAAED